MKITTQYIDKDALVEVIEKAIDEPAPSHDQQCPWEDGYYCGLIKAESIIDNFEVKEVKEVDLNKEIYEAEKRFGDIDEMGGYRILIFDDEFRDVLHHFFELGRNASHKQKA